MIRSSEPVGSSALYQGECEDNAVGTHQDKLSSVWHEVRTWPARTRLALALRILHSLEQEWAPPQRLSPADMIGVWKIKQRPSDAEIQGILEEEKMKKHG